MSPSGPQPLRSGGDAPAEGPSAEPIEEEPAIEPGKSSPGPLPSSPASGEGTATSSPEGTEEESEEEEEEEEGSEAGKPDGAAAPAAGPTELRKSVGRFVLFFMGFLGLYMLIDPSARNSIAQALGLILQPALGFDGHYVLVTMFLTAAVEMAASALAYHYYTDWIESAKVQQHNAAIRPLWTKALRKQNKEHMDALKPHMDQLNVRQSKVTIAQFKGMVLTYVLLIAIYTWMGLFIFAQCPKPAINASETSISAPIPEGDRPFFLNASVSGGYGPFSYQWWMQGTSNTGSTENATGPSGPLAGQWIFSPPASGVYLISIATTDARGSTQWGYLSLQYYSNAATPTTTPPVFECKGTAVVLFGANTNLLGPVGPFPLWFLAFSLYTVPLNLVFRRYLKHTALAPQLQTLELPPAEPPLASSGGGGT